MKWLSCLPLSLGLLALPCCLVAANPSQHKYKATAAMPEDVYFDFSMSFGTYIWNYIEWSPNVQLQEDQMNLYLTSLFSQMKQAGQTTIHLAFAQLENIDYYASGNFVASGIETRYDVVAAVLNALQADNVQVPGYDQFLDYFIAQAHSNQMKVALSFGGGDAADIQFKILQQPDETYAGQAQKLFNFMQKYQIDIVDFDIEYSTAISSQPLDPNGESIATFFKTLHDLLTPQGQYTYLTSMLDLRWPNSYLKSLFYDADGNLIFNQLFNGVNLMAYSDTQYWLDPTDIGWGIEQWIDLLGTQATPMVHIGFDDQVAYASSSANGGNYKYTIKPGSTDGQAAAQIYLQLQQKLIADGYTVPLATPFYWPSANVNLGPYYESRYRTTGNQSSFVSQAMQDFFNYLNPNFQKK